MEVPISSTVAMTLRPVRISEHRFVHLKYAQFRFVSYTSVMLEANVLRF